MKDFLVKLKEIKDRCDKVANGPWRVVEDDSSFTVNSNEDCGIEDGFGFKQLLLSSKPHMHAYDCFFNQKETMSFIAHSRTDVPMLLEMVEVAIRDLNSIVIISKDNCKNLSQATLGDFEKIMEKYK